MTKDTSIYCWRQFALAILVSMHIYLI